VEDVSGLSEESFLTPATAQKNEAAKTEEVERTGGKAKEPDPIPACWAPGAFFV
jgi:hypothetical protein